MKKTLLLLAALSLGLSACNRSKIENPIKFISVKDRPTAAEISAEWLNTTEMPTLQGSAGKVILLNFWATWCGPCRMEIPGLIETYHKNKEKGFTILGLSLDMPDPRRGMTEESNRKMVSEFVADNRIAYPVGLANPMSAQAYQVSSIPASYLIDKKGRIAAVLIGLYPEEKINDAVERLLEEK